MTRVVTNVELAQQAVGTSMLPGEGEFPIRIRLRDGTRWQLDGVKWLVDESGNAVEFELQVGPDESQNDFVERRDLPH